MAYHVGENIEGGHVITFATNGATARREGANELGLTFEEVAFCRRVPWADQYAGQPFIPAKAYHDAGWWLSCDNCLTMIYDDEEDADGKPLEMVYDGQHVYCNQGCQDARINAMDESNERGDQFMRRVRELYPDLRFTSFRCGWPYVRMTAEFTFPGCLYGGSLVDREGTGELEAWICGADADAWRVYERSRQRAKQEVTA